MTRQTHRVAMLEEATARAEICRQYAEKAIRTAQQQAERARIAVEQAQAALERARRRAGM